MGFFFQHSSLNCPRIPAWDGTRPGVVCCSSAWQTRPLVGQGSLDGCPGTSADWGDRETPEPHRRAGCMLACCCRARKRKAASCSPGPASLSMLRHRVQAHAEPRPSRQGQPRRRECHRQTESRREPGLKDPSDPARGHTLPLCPPRSPPVPSPRHNLLSVLNAMRRPQATQQPPSRCCFAKT